MYEKGCYKDSFVVFEMWKNVCHKVSEIYEISLSNATKHICEVKRNLLNQQLGNKQTNKQRSKKKNALKKLYLIYYI